MTQQLMHSQGLTARSQTVEPILASDLLAYLRQTHQIAPLAIAAEQDARIVQACQQLEIEILDAELQAAGDAYRIQHRLTSVPQIIAWLETQRITLEDWSEGIRRQLLSQKLQEFLFSEAVDNYYLQNRKQYDRVALSQIVVATLSLAETLYETLAKVPETFCALSLQHSILKDAHKNGGFMGVCFRSELQAEFIAAISDVDPGRIVGPIATATSYCILKVEHCLPTQLSPTLRTQIMHTLLQSWLAA